MAFHPLSRPAGSVLFRAGEPCRGLLLLAQGSVRVDLVGEDGQRLMLYRIGPGETCAATLACLFGQEPYAAEGVAETPIAGDWLPAEAFEDTLAADPAFRRAVLRGFGARLAALMWRIEELRFLSVDRRLAAWLLARAPGPVPAPREAVAREIGTAREVVSRRLAALARQGLVRLSGGEVLLRDREGLAALAQGA
jgi:CRP/FNR family transcriptional regulator